MERRPVMENRSGPLITLQSHTHQTGLDSISLRPCPHVPGNFHKHIILIAVVLAFHPHANGFLAPPDLEKKHTTLCLTGCLRVHRTTAVLWLASLLAALISAQGLFV